ncbi:MAG: hypothetical protein OXN21_07365 [Chloroflexota bacterium]|nr:hypothetical protein [Chloroflexota bacterium]
MRIGGFYIETSLNAYDFLSMALLSLIWFLGIFSFRIGLAFLELLPELGSLEAGFELVPRLQLLTAQPILTSLLLSVVLGPITHSAITRSTLIKVFRELSFAEDTSPEDSGEGVETAETDRSPEPDDSPG